MATNTVVIRFDIENKLFDGTKEDFEKAIKGEIATGSNNLLQFCLGMYAGRQNNE